MRVKCVSPVKGREIVLKAGDVGIGEVRECVSCFGCFFIEFIGECEYGKVIGNVVGEYVVGVGRL